MRQPHIVTLIADRQSKTPTVVDYSSRGYMVGRSERLPIVELGMVRKPDFAFAGPQSLRVAQLLEVGTFEIGAIHNDAPDGRGCQFLYRDNRNACGLWRSALRGKRRAWSPSYNTSVARHESLQRSSDMWPRAGGANAIDLPRRRNHAIRWIVGCGCGGQEGVTYPEAL